MKNISSNTSQADIELILNALVVEFVGLSQCLVSPGYRLELGGLPAAGIHYNLRGNGVAFVDNHAPIPLQPHTLIVVPPNTPFRIEVADSKNNSIKIINGNEQYKPTNEVNRFVAGDDANPEIILFCGFFNASYANTIELFENLMSPFVEQFDENDRIDEKLAMALDELVTQEIGAKAMSAALLKQVIVMLLRRSYKSPYLWTERFSMLKDPNMAKVFALMTADPSAPHTVVTLADAAYLSRSAFMAKFTSVFGKPVMSVLRDLRLRQAAVQLRTGNFSIDQIARNSGYVNRSSFSKAFKKMYLVEPTEY